jgi:hypothetical protein
VIKNIPWHVIVVIPVKEFVQGQKQTVNILMVITNIAQNVNAILLQRISSVLVVAQL